MKKALRIGVAIICMVAIVVGYYYYLSHKRVTAAASDDTELSEVQAILTKDFANDYPVTPRAVVKWYNRIITAYYSEDFSDEELVELAVQARSLLDEELLSYNPEESYITALKTEIQDYHNRECSIVNFDVSDSGEVVYRRVNGYDCAYVQSYYFVREGSTYTRTYEDYCLRKDSNGNWKILTWQLSKEDDTNGF